MLDINKDLENFLQSLHDTGLDYKFADDIITSIVNQLVSETCNRFISHPTSLNRIQILTIQRFLSGYNFHIEYCGSKNHLEWYKILPNWK